MVGQDEYEDCILPGLDRIPCQTMQEVIGHKQVIGRSSLTYVIITEGWPSWFAIVGLLGEPPL